MGQTCSSVYCLFLNPHNDCRQMITKKFEMKTRTVTISRSIDPSMLSIPSFLDDDYKMAQITDSGMRTKALADPKNIDLPLAESNYSILSATQLAMRTSTLATPRDIEFSGDDYRLVSVTKFVMKMRTPAIPSNIDPPFSDNDYRMASVTENEMRTKIPTIPRDIDSSSSFTSSFSSNEYNDYKMVSALESEIRARIPAIWRDIDLTDSWDIFALPSIGFTGICRQKRCSIGYFSMGRLLLNPASHLPQLNISQVPPIHTIITYGI